MKTGNRCLVTLRDWIALIQWTMSQSQGSCILALILQRYKYLGAKTATFHKIRSFCFIKVIFYHLILREGKKGLYVPLFKICNDCLFFSLLLTVASILYELFAFLFTSVKSHKTIDDFLFILSHQEHKSPSNQIQNYQSTSKLLTKFLINP